MSTAVLPFNAWRRPAALGRGSNDFSYTVRLLAPYLTGTALLFLAKPSLLRPIFPLSTAVIGYLLYKRNESYFLSFLLWIYMLAPLLRRLVDWRTSYQEQSMILVAPLLVTLLPGMHLRRRLLRAVPVIRKAALLTLSAIAFGTGVGMIKHPGMNVILAALTWTAPIILCVFAATIREREMLPRVLTYTLLWGALLLSAYGIYQFVYAPPWDTYWLKLVSIGEAATSPSFGQPKRFGLRVWSTMNAPGPLGAFLSVAILWFIPRKGAAAALVVTASCTVLLLTMGRGVWFQTVVGILILAVGSGFKMSFRNLGVTLLVFVLFAGALQRLPGAADVNQRLTTFTHLSSDASANERQEMYGYLEGVILTTPMGNGLDTTHQIHEYPLDSSLLLLFLMTGWLGTCLYLGGLGIVGAAVLLSLRTSSIPRLAGGTCVLAGMTQLGSGDILLRQGGILLWLFAGLWASLPRVEIRRVAP